jgi:hypothetical protein
MKSVLSFSLGMLLTSLPSVIAQTPCCLFGGDGGVTMIADGVITLPDVNGQPGTSATLAPISVGSGTSSSGDSFVSIIIGSTKGVEDSLAGWIITANSTGQTLTLWYGLNEEGRTPTCSRSSAAYPDSFVSSTKLCCGSGNDGTFTDYIGSYMQGSTAVSWFGMNKTSSSMISVTNGQCIPVTLLSPMSPLGGGAFSLSIQGGGPEPAPSAWADAPSACGF